MVLPKMISCKGSILGLFLLASCQAAPLSQGGADRSAQEDQRVCVTSNDSEYTRLTNRLRNQLTGLDSDVMGTPGVGGEVSHIRFSKCGWMDIGPDEDGVTRRMAFHQLYGDINYLYGKPVSLKARSYLRQASARSGFEAANSTISVGYISTTSLASSQQAVERLNSTLNNLSRIATGQTIQARSGADQAASVRGTQAHLGAIASTVIGIAAVAASTPSSPETSTSSERNFQCTVTCSTSALVAGIGLVGDSRRDLIARITATSISAAKDYARQNGGNICRHSDLYYVTGQSVTCR